MKKKYYNITGYEESTKSSSSGGDDDDDDSKRPPPGAGAGVGSGTGRPTATSRIRDFRSQDPKEGTPIKHPKLDILSTPKREHPSHTGGGAAAQEQTAQVPSGEKKHSSTPGKAEHKKQYGFSDTEGDKTKMSKAVSDFPPEPTHVEPSEAEGDAESYDTSLPPSTSQTGRSDGDP